MSGTNALLQEEAEDLLMKTIRSAGAFVLLSLTTTLYLQNEDLVVFVLSNLDSDQIVGLVLTCCAFGGLLVEILVLWQKQISEKGRILVTAIYMSILAYMLGHKQAQQSYFISHLECNQVVMALCFIFPCMNTMAEIALGRISFFYAPKDTPKDQNDPTLSGMAYSDMEKRSTPRTEEQKQRDKQEEMRMKQMGK